MPSSATELEPARNDDPTPSRRNASDESDDTKATHTNEPQHFSPDPYESTDRYRLVTPYTLAKHS